MAIASGVLTDPSRKSLLESSLGKLKSNGFYSLRNKERQFYNPTTGELLSRRQFDKQYGTLKAQGYTSYEAKAKNRKGTISTGKPKYKPVVDHYFKNLKRRHLWYKLVPEQLPDMIAYLNQTRGFNDTVIFLLAEGENDEGQFISYQTRTYNPLETGIEAVLLEEFEALKKKYITVKKNYLVWSESAVKP